MPAEALDCLRRRAMVPGDDLPPLFGIEMAGYLGRADQIAEKYRQMPPLASGTSCGSPVRYVGCFCGSADRGDRWLGESGAAVATEAWPRAGISEPHFGQRRPSAPPHSNAELLTRGILEVASLSSASAFLQRQKLIRLSTMFRGSRAC